MKPTSAWVRNVDETTFEQAVLETSDSVPVIVDFWAPWCNPCRLLAPILEKLVNEQNGKVILAKVNTDEAQRLAMYFRIEGIPAIKIFYRRQLVHEFEGMAPEPALRDLIEQLIKLAGQEGGVEGEEPVEQPAEDPAEVENRNRELLATDSDNQQARVDLAGALLAQNKLDEIPEILETVGSSGDVGEASDRILAQVFLRKAAAALPSVDSLRKQIAEDPKNAQAKLDLGTRLASQDKYEEALPLILSAGELDFNLLSNKVKEIMVKVFYALGTAHSLSNEYRTKLSRLLY